MTSAYNSVRTIGAVAAMLVLLSFGCTSVYLHDTTAAHYAKTKPEDVEVLADKPERPYEELGTMSASYFHLSQGSRDKKLRRQAASLGANALIITSDDWGVSPYRIADAVAIRYK
jgi:hypothetical protein